MAAQADKKRIQLHGSAIGMLNACGIQFQFRYIDGIKRSPAKNTVAGTGTHKAIEVDLQNKIDTEELLPLSDVTDVAATEVKKQVKEYGLDLQDAEEMSRGKEAVLGEAIDRAVKLSELHHHAVAPHIMPSKVSRKFSINMDSFLRSRAKRLYEEAERVSDKFNRKIRESQARALNALAAKGLDYSGEQDIVEHVFAPTDDGDDMKTGILWIRDSKTKSKSPNSGEADESDQLSGYALASQVLDGKLPDSMMLDHLIITPKRGDTKAVTQKTTRTDEDIEVFLNRFTNAVHALHTGVFTPAKPDDWRCSARWCGYHSICPYASRPKSTLVTIDTE